MRAYGYFGVFVGLLFVTTVAHADWKARVSVRVNTTRTNGQAWDEFGGAPDLRICIVTPSNTACDPTRWGMCRDAFECGYDAIIPNGPFTVWVYDADVLENEPIGAATCKGKGNEWRTRACTVQAPLKSVGLSR